MSNDDRDAPRWGDGAPQDQHHDRTPDTHGDGDTPRYGERITPTPDATRDERTDGGQQQYGQQDQHGQQDQYGRQQQDQYAQQQNGQQQDLYGQQRGQQQWGDHNDRPGAHQYAATDGRPGDGAWNARDEPKRKKKTVGVVAFIVGLLALVAGIVTGILIGNAIAGSSAFQDAITQSSSGGTTDSQELQRRMMDDPALIGAFGAGGLLFVVGTVLGLWAIVQGIIAAVTNRGRAFGVLAIVLAVVGLIATVVVLGAMVSAAV